MNKTVVRTLYTVGILVLPIPNTGVAFRVAHITSILRNCVGEQADQS